MINFNFNLRFPKNNVVLIMHFFLVTNNLDTAEPKNEST